MRVVPPEVVWVRPGSLADAAGIGPGDLVVRVNGRAPRDYIEYRYLIAEPRVSLAIRKPDGRLRRMVIQKHEDEDLGLRFARDVFDGIRTCRNRCAFCFVSQLPRGLRPSLYVRDDDYRLSYLHGNFVTLTNLTPADRRRIVRDHLSPLYVSVHATQPEVRRQLFGGETPDPLIEMARLAKRGIEFHAQIVVCPGINDGEHLERTVRDLAALHPGVRSVGVVPVGLTRHRAGLPHIRRVSADLAAAIIDHVHAWQRELRRQVGSRFVFAADELYLLAGRPLPPRRAYEGLWQMGNGIGGARLFLDELGRLRPLKLARPVSAILVTGEMAAGMVQQLADRLRAVGEVEARVCVVANRLFGRSVTTAGLLAGRDILRALGRRPACDVVLVPGTAVREEEGFIDGVTIEELIAAVRRPVLAAAGPRQAAAALARFARSGVAP